MLQKLRRFAQENPWATYLLANPGLVAARPQGNEGAEDTPPAGPMIGDEHALSPPRPAAPVAHRDLSTPERPIEQPSHTTQLPPSTNVALTQPPASVTPPAPESSIQSSERPQKTPHPHLEYAVLEDIAQVENNWRFPSFEFNYFFIFTPNTQIPYCILDLVFFLES